MWTYIKWHRSRMFEGTHVVIAWNLMYFPLHIHHLQHPIHSIVSFFLFIFSLPLSSLRYFCIKEFMHLLQLFESGICEKWRSCIAIVSTSSTVLVESCLDFYMFLILVWFGFQFRSPLLVSLQLLFWFCEFNHLWCVTQKSNCMPFFNCIWIHFRISRVGAHETISHRSALKFKYPMTKIWFSFEANPFFEGFFVLVLLLLSFSLESFSICLFVCLFTFVSFAQLIVSFTLSFVFYSFSFNSLTCFVLNWWKSAKKW